MQSVHAHTIGAVVRDLGAGRLTRETVLDHDVGVDRLAKPGDEVRPGAPLARIHARTEDHAHMALLRLRDAFPLADVPPEQRPLVLGVFC